LFVVYFARVAFNFQGSLRWGRPVFAYGFNFYMPRRWNACCEEEHRGQERSKAHHTSIDHLNICIFVCVCVCACVYGFPQLVRVFGLVDFLFLVAVFRVLCDLNGVDAKCVVSKNAV
jgi:hypothetical protein